MPATGRGAAAVGALGHAGVRAAPLRHLVLPGRGPAGDSVRAQAASESDWSRLPGRWPSTSATSPRSAADRGRGGRAAARRGAACSELAAAGRRPTFCRDASGAGARIWATARCCLPASICRRPAGRCRDRRGAVTVDRGLAYEQLRQVTPWPAWCWPPNPGPMTLDGTNTWLLARPARPGRWWSTRARDEAHLAACWPRGRQPVVLILLTHGHADHSEGAARFAALAGAPCARSTRRTGSATRGSPAGTCWTSPGCDRGVATPGHTADSLSFVLSGDRRATGRGGAHRRHRARPRHHGGRPPGRPARRVPGLACAGCPTSLNELQAVLPGHGPVLRRRLELSSTTWRTARSGWSRCARRCEAAADRPQEVVEIGVRGRGARALARGDGRCGRSWTTCVPSRPEASLGRTATVSAPGGPAAPRPGRPRTCPPAAASRGGRSRPAPCSPSRGRRRPAGPAPPGSGRA